MKTVVFHESTALTLGTYTFQDDRPVQVVTAVDASFEAEFTIYDEDGRGIVKAKATQLYRLEASADQDIGLSYQHGRTVCSREGRAIFQLERVAPAALKSRAQLLACKGWFVI